MEQKPSDTNGPSRGGPGGTGEEGPPGGGAAARGRPNTPRTFLLVLAAMFILFLVFSSQASRRSEIDFSFFRQQVKDGNVTEVELQGQQLYGKFKKPPLDPEHDAKGSKKSAEPERLKEEFSVFVHEQHMEQGALAKLLEEHGVKERDIPPTDSTSLIMMAWLVLSMLIFFGIFMMYRRTRDQFMGGGMFSGFTKSPAKRYDASNKRVTFNEVAGLEGVKSDLEEVVDFLKNPEKFQRLGGRVPKGVLLMGPPGTGKTLLARAVAGEAGVPFYSINGSEFIQMFVGVGAGRVRDMFKTAKDNSPSILFIDEIDAVGRQRGAGLGGGHDEREQTLNQILSEMDGFSQNESVIVLAATNRPDVLDPALLRPGRFDRHITVDRPSQKGRREIFEVHVRDVPLSPDVDLDTLAAGTVGLTGADIRNLVNEAALWATRHGKDRVEMDDFEHARDKILMGAKREEVLVGKEKTMTAYHEAGHALLAWFVPGADTVHKVTIIPRGRALGVTQLLPEEDRLSIGESDLHARLVFMLGGRAAEKLIFDEFSAGAENDLKEATRIARRMVTHWGMSERLGPVAYRNGEEHPFLGREMASERQYSEHTAQVIDEEVARILHAAADRARQLLSEYRPKLDALATALEEKEILDNADLEELLGPSVNVRSRANGRPAEEKASAESPSRGGTPPSTEDQTEPDGTTAARGDGASSDAPDS